MENMFTAYLDTWLRAQTCDVADGAVRIPGVTWSAGVVFTFVKGKLLIVRLRQ